MSTNRLIETYEKISDLYESDFYTVALEFLKKEKLFFEIVNSESMSDEQLHLLKKLSKDLSNKRTLLEDNSNIALKNIPYIKSRLYIIAIYYLEKIMDIDEKIKEDISKKDCLYVNTLTTSNILRLGSEELFDDTYARVKLIEFIYKSYGENILYKYLLINKKLKAKSNHDIYYFLKNEEFDYETLLDLLNGESSINKYKSGVIASKILKKELKTTKNTTIHL